MYYNQDADLSFLEGTIGYPNYLTLLSMENEHGSEIAGKKLRELMPWLTKP